MNIALANFLAHSVELESEARQRYQELSEMLAQHHNVEVAEFFARMAHEASEHLAEVQALAQGHTLPRLHAWEFDWPEPEAPESASYEALHYRMSLMQAVDLALHNERAARDYYAGYAQRAEQTDDAETAAVAQHFAAEEQSHAEQLEALLQTLQPESPYAALEDDEPHMPE
tara:strand:- start:90513 stop:91028 length:516 start_codon:yes stop_codon:yes gene_type:complete